VESCGSSISESNPSDSLDLVLVVNGVLIVTAELKNPPTHETVDHAMEQYRTDRKPHDLIFSRRTLVHFAVDPHLVAMTTRLAGDQTRFLSFNTASAGPGRPGLPATRPATATRRRTCANRFGSAMHGSIW
jgi:type I restriction enzyme R subunit